MAISNRVAKIVFNITRAHTAHTHHTIVQCTNKRMTFFCSFFFFFHFSSSASCHDWHTNCVHSHKSMKFVSFVCPVVPFVYSLVFGFRWANSAYFACVALTRARTHTQCTFRSWIILMMPFGFRFAGISGYTMISYCVWKCSKVESVQMRVFATNRLSQIYNIFSFYYSLLHRRGFGLDAHIYEIIKWERKNPSKIERIEAYVYE